MLEHPVHESSFIFPLKTSCTCGCQAGAGQSSSILMELQEALKQKKPVILSQWLERTFDSYASSTFFKQAKDPFANPVGANITSGLTSLFDLLLTSSDPVAYRQPLDQVVRIRAVQDFTPAQAIAPFLELKWVVKQVFSKDKDTQPLLGTLDIFDCEVDRIALMAFDIYTECREQLFRNRIRELKSGSALLTDSACPSAILRKDQAESTKNIAS